jgi:hypothetical protein
MTQMLKNTFIFNFLIRIIFYFIFTPISLFLKIFKYDPLQINLVNKKTYWKQIKGNDEDNTNYPLWQ